MYNGIISKLAGLFASQKDAFVAAVNAIPDAKTNLIVINVATLE